VTIERLHDPRRSLRRWTGQGGSNTELSHAVEACALAQLLRPPRTHGARARGRDGTSHAPFTFMGSPRLMFGLVTSGAIAFSAVGTNEPLVTPPLPYGWTAVGQVTLDRNGCAECPATFPTPDRSVAFGLASDSPFAISLAGRFDVICSDGSTYDVFLNSPTRRGVFQLVPNRCVNYESTSVTVSITTVSLSPPDENRSIVLTVFGTN